MKVIVDAPQSIEVNALRNTFYLQKEFIFYLRIYLLVTQQNLKMITKEDNKLIQFKKQGKREKMYPYNKLSCITNASEIYWREVW